MKLKKLVQVMFMSCALLGLAACSTTGSKNSEDTSVLDANDDGGVQATGADNGDGFGDNASGGPSSQSGRVYYFSFDSNTVRDEDKPAIFANANYLVSHSNAKIILEGHTDPRGSREYNVALGERRANAVMELLQSKGVNSNQIRVVSYGAERLAAPGRSEEDYQLDRRAVIVYQQK